MGEWRPKEWANPWPGGKYLNEDDCQRLREAYERGAQAMYAALALRIGYWVEKGKIIVKENSDA